ncbi:MAG: hypothetical protein PHN69_07590 [Candidatus Pacebacteria bacterium]|jgi:hypothetical protein|nr:hypothetical protein [Candidatus Paceibacterota bacterium]
MKIGEVAKIVNNGKEISTLSKYGANKGLMELKFGMLQILNCIGLDFYEAFLIAYREGVTCDDVI